MLAKRIIPILDALADDFIVAGGLAGSDGYDIDVACNGMPISFAPPSEQVGLTTSAGVALSGIVDGAAYTVAVRARKAHGAAGTPAELMVRLLGQDGGLVARPNSPSGLTARAIAGGGVLLQWAFSDLGATVAAASFGIFSDGGSGTMNWTAPIATAEQYDRRAIVSGLTEGVRHLLGVRAISGDAVADGNRALVAVVPRSAAPPGVGELLASQI